MDGADYRAADIGGKRTMSRWWVDNLPRLRALRELEQTEAGFLWEGKDGFVNLDPGDHRSSAASRVVHATFTDTTPSTGEIPVLRNGFVPDNALRDLANQISTLVRQFSVEAEATLWSTTNLTIPANTTISLTLRYPGRRSPRDRIGVNAWVTPVAGTDYTAQTGVAITFATSGNEATITFANSGGEATFPAFRVRGTPLAEDDPLEIVSQDSDSVAEHGVYPYNYPAPWLSNIQDVISQHSFNLRLFASPAERVTAKWVADRFPAEATAIDLSDRVTVSRRGTMNDYFVESVEFVQRVPWIECWLTLSPARFYGSIIVLNQGPALNEVSLLAA